VTLRAQVDDKYQYSLENEDNKVHGWISADPPVGFWIITPSNEFRTGGPIKQDLTSHAGPIALSVSSPHLSYLTTTYLSSCFVLFYNSRDRVLDHLNLGVCV
jgi:hypothetical protein